MTIPAEDNQIGVPFMAQPFIRPMMNLGGVGGVADLTTILGQGQRSQPANFPAVGLDILFVGQMGTRPGPAAGIADAQLAGQHHAGGLAVLGTKGLAAYVTIAGDRLSFN